MYNNSKMIIKTKAIKFTMSWVLTFNFFLIAKKVLTYEKKSNC